MLYLIMSSVLDKIYIWSKESVVDEILIFAALIALIETYAQNTLKRSENGMTKLQGMLVYGMVGYTLHYAYTKFPLSKVNITWSSISIVIATVSGYLLYNEGMDAWKIAAVVFGMLSIYSCNQS